jgi:hypothetical protein
MNNKQQIQTVGKVLAIIKLAFELSNLVEETIPSEKIERLDNLIQYCNSEDAELDECVNRMHEFNSMLESDEFLQGGLVLEKKEPFAEVKSGERVLNSCSGLDTHKIIFRPKSECTGNGIFDKATFKNESKEDQDEIKDFEVNDKEDVFYQNRKAINSEDIEGLQKLLSGAINSKSVQIIPVNENSIQIDKEELSSLVSKIKASCAEIINEANVRWGGDSTFEDPAEDIQACVGVLESYLNNQLPKI